MAGYTKLFHTIITSSIWAEDLETKIIWITLLALKNKDGVAETTIPGLARMAGVPLEKTREIVQKLQEPDLDSRSKEYEGRRIEEVDGGYLLLNAGKYSRLLSQEERREYYRKKQAEHRQREWLKCQTPVNNVNISQQMSTENVAKCQKLSTIDIDIDIDKDIKKNIYSEFVLLSDNEYKKLINAFGEQGTKDRIQSLNDYIGSKGKRYKSHYHTIMMWERKNISPAPKIKPEDKKCVICGKHATMMQGGVGLCGPTHYEEWLKKS